MERNKISFEVPGQPHGKKETVNFVTYIKEMFVIGYPGFIPLEGALRMTITVWMMIPKSTSKKRMKFMIDRVIRPTKKPGISNILKSAEDALNSLAYHDDKQIVTAICHKYYAVRPRLEIEIMGARI